MIIRKKHYSFDDRCFSHKGCVIDIGCYTWDWSKDFINKKEIIGIDYCEKEEIAGTKLIRKMIMPYKGECSVHIDGYGSTVMDKKGDSVICETITLEDVLDGLNCMPSVMKVNIEGAEYPLLFSLRGPPSDQLIVSFHDWGEFCYPKKLSETVREYLSIWYDWKITYERYSWWIGLLKDKYRIY